MLEQTSLVFGNYVFLLFFFDQSASNVTLYVCCVPNKLITPYRLPFLFFYSLHFLLAALLIENEYTQCSMQSCHCESVQQYLLCYHYKMHWNGTEFFYQEIFVIYSYLLKKKASSSMLHKFSHSSINLKFFSWGDFNSYIQSQVIYQYMLYFHC